MAQSKHYNGILMSIMGTIFCLNTSLNITVHKKYPMYMYSYTEKLNSLKLSIVVKSKLMVRKFPLKDQNVQNFTHFCRIVIMKAVYLIQKRLPLGLGLWVPLIAYTIMSDFHTSPLMFDCLWLSKNRYEYPTWPGLRSGWVLMDCTPNELRNDLARYFKS